MSIHICSIMRPALAHGRCLLVCPSRRGARPVSWRHDHWRLPPPNSPFLPRACKRGMSVTVSDANIGARRLYELLGYRETARRPMVKEQWVNEGHEWVLITKVL